MKKQKENHIILYDFSELSKNENIKKKVKKTMKDNGNDYFFNSDKYKEYILEKYGVTNISKSKEHQLKKEETCLKNYGVRFPSHSEEIHNRQHSGYILKCHDTGLCYRGSYEKRFYRILLRKKYRN